MSRHPIALTVNGRIHEADVPARLTLADFLRERLDLTATHLGCEHGVCGACTVLVDGNPVRSCLMFAVQADGAVIRTVEGLADAGGTLSAVQRAFHQLHGMQCGFCTPGFLISLTALLDDDLMADEDEILDALSGNLCRCTGYANIVAAARLAQQLLLAEQP